MKKGRPTKALPTDGHAPMVTVKKAVNQPMMEAALEMANGLLERYKQEKEAIQHKYRECDYFKEGIEYKSQLSRSIGHIEAIELLIKQIKELLK
jgi:hypothetical protein